MFIREEGVIRKGFIGDGLVREEHFWERLESSEERFSLAIFYIKWSCMKTHQTNNTHNSPHKFKCFSQEWIERFTNTMQVWCRWWRCEGCDVLKYTTLRCLYFVTRFQYMKKHATRKHTITCCKKVVNFIKSVKIRLVATCHLQTC